MTEESSCVTDGCVRRDSNVISRKNTFDKIILVHLKSSFESEQLQRYCHLLINSFHACNMDWWLLMLTRERVHKADQKSGAVLIIPAPEHPLFEARLSWAIKAGDDSCILMFLQSDTTYFWCHNYPSRLIGAPAHISDWTEETLLTTHQSS